MDQMNSKERLAILCRAGFTSREIKRLCQMRRDYSENELDQAPADLSHLQFVRWLVQHGRLTEQCVENNTSARGDVKHV